MVTLRTIVLFSGSIKYYFVRIDVRLMWKKLVKFVALYTSKVSLKSSTRDWCTFFLKSAVQTHHNVHESHELFHGTVPRQFAF